MKYVTLLALILSSNAYAQGCFGPACTPPELPAPEYLLCLPEGCSEVTYSVGSRFTIAESTLPNGYSVMGWSGPCLQEVCPDVRNQAYTDLELNAKRANRAQRY